MSYIESIDQHWADTYRAAQEGGANEQQLQCIADLSDYEFGRRSDNRLRRECFWDTKVDRDGDVVLTIEDPVQLIEREGVRLGRRLTIVIDHTAIITMTDSATGKVVVFDPHADQKPFTDLDLGVPPKPLIWVLDEEMIAPYTEPSLLFMRINDRWVCDVEGSRLQPFLFGKFSAKRFKTEELLEYVQASMYYDGPVNGYCRVNGELCWFREAYEDDVSGDRIYAVNRLSFAERLKAVYNMHISRLEIPFNRKIRRWPAKTSSYVKFFRFDETKFGNERPADAFCMF